GNRRAHEIPLNCIATLCLEEFELRRGGDAFGDHFEVQAMPERDDCARDRCIIRILIDVRHERAVDFERVDRKSLQKVERAIAGAEIVYGKAETELLERQQRT